MGFCHEGTNKHEALEFVFLRVFVAKKLVPR